jgi:hypothetical protein
MVAVDMRIPKKKKRGAEFPTFDTVTSNATFVSSPIGISYELSKI